MSGRRRLSRKPATRMPAARVVIVTEGARTEPEYFKTFVRIHSAPTVEVIPIGLGGDPRKVVDQAITELRNLRQDAHISRKDSVWAVFDRDEPRALRRRRTLPWGMALDWPFPTPALNFGVSFTTATWTLQCVAKIVSAFSRKTVRPTPFTEENSSMTRRSSRRIILMRLNGDAPP